MQKTENEIIYSAKDYTELMPKIIQDCDNIAKDCNDYFIKTLKNRVNFTEDEKFYFEQESIIEPELTLTPTENAFSQMCTKIGFPTDLYNKQKNKMNVSKLANENINTHLQKYEGKLMIRTYKNLIRGVLSQRYTAFDSDKIVHLLAEAVDDNNQIYPNDLKIHSYLNNFERLHIRLINKNELNINGTPAYAGLTINTSDVGENKISIKFYIYNGINSNGICLDEFKEKLFETAHIHISQQEIKNSLRNCFRNFPEIMKNATIYIQNAENFKLINSALYDNESALTAFIQSNCNLSKKDMKNIINIAENKPKNLWNYVTSITEYAKTQDFEKRLEIEKKAGKILLFPDKFGILAG